MGREAQGLHLPVKTPCFVHLGISCELGNRKKWDGRQTGGIYLWKANVLRSLEWDQQYAHWGFHNRVWRPKDLKTSESETVDGQNIQTLQHALCWTPAPNLNVSARVLAKVMLGVWLFSSIGANALQVTITLNFEGEGVVPHRRGLNISSIYGTNWGVRHAAHPSWYRLALWCFHIFWSPNSVVETSMCMLLISFQTAQNIGFSQVNASCLSPVPFFSIP